MSKSENVRISACKTEMQEARINELKQAAGEVAGGPRDTNQGRNGEAGMCWPLTANKATGIILSQCLTIKKLSCCLKVTNNNARVSRM